MSIPPLTRMEQLLLMAAAVHGYGPQTDITRANTGVIVWQVVQWTGLDTADVRAQWDSIEWHPALDEVYTPLVRMTLQLERSGSGRKPERLGEPLFEGGGNWGVPADPDRPACNPRFNACRLTALGERVAQALLELHPECRRPT